jgi:hypothetical protein
MIGVLGFDTGGGLGNFLFTTASRTALTPTQPPIQWVPGALSLGVKRPEREADHSPPSSAEVKERVNYISTLPKRLHGVVLSLKKAQGQLYLYLYAHFMENRINLQKKKLNELYLRVYVSYGDNFCIYPSS